MVTQLHSVSKGNVSVFSGSAAGSTTRVTLFQKDTLQRAFWQQVGGRERGREGERDGM